MERASVAFRVQRVRRIYELHHAPRVAPPLYVLEVAATLLGRLLHVGRLRTVEPDGGWRARPAYRWERPGDWAPRGQHRKAAMRAVNVARTVMDGGWESSFHAAAARVQRMQRRRDGTATRESIYYMLRDAVGSVEQHVRGHASRLIL